MNEAAGDFSSLRGQLLVSMPSMQGDYFSHSVTLLIEHNRDGAFGLVISNPLEADLASLLTEFDVVAHEYGHHIVFAKVTSTQGDALIIHEGLSDAFVTLMTDDTCIANSICPNGSAACFLANQELH